MIGPTTLAGVRAELGAALELVLPADVHMITDAPSGPVALPAVVLGMPRIADFGDMGGYTTVEWPVAVVVPTPTGDQSEAIAELESIWPVVSSKLLDMDNDPATNWVALEVKRAEFGLFTINGTNYPAQTIWTALTI